MKKTEIQQQVRSVLRASPVRASVRCVSLFGSYARGEESRDSDIDLLIEFSSPVSLFEIVGLEQELTKRLHRKVDLRTPKALNKYFRDDVLQEAQPLYEKRGNYQGNRPHEIPPIIHASVCSVRELLEPLQNVSC